MKTVLFSGVVFPGCTQHGVMQTLCPDGEQTPCFEVFPERIYLDQFPVVLELFLRLRNWVYFICELLLLSEWKWHACSGEL